MKLLRELLFFLRRYIVGLPELIHNACMWRLNSVRKGKAVDVRGRIYIKNAGTFTLGSDAKINSSMYANPIGGDTRTFIVVSRGAVLEIGHHVGLSNVTIYCAQNVTIGDYVLIGGGCRIYDTDFHPVDYRERVLDGKKGPTAAVVIEQGVWLCGGVTILKGVRVGARSVVACGSVVTRDIPPDELWGGVPARFIRKINGKA